jgi:hypothetical protein
MKTAVVEVGDLLSVQGALGVEKQVRRCLASSGWM